MEEFYFLLGVTPVSGRQSLMEEFYFLLENNTRVWKSLMEEFYFLLGVTPVSGRMEEFYSL